MIALFGKHIRKWLLRLALAARNQAQTIVARLESGEEGGSRGADRDSLPGAAKTAHLGGPPTHWVEMVRRHAPELLHPAPAPVALQAPSQVFETDAGMDESAATAFQDRQSSSGAMNGDDVPTRGDPTVSLKRPGLSKEYDDTSGRWRTPTRDDKRQTSGSSRPHETAPKHPRDDSATPPREATQADSVNVNRSAMSPPDVEKTTQERFLGVQHYNMTGYPKAQGSETQEPEISVVQASAKGRIEKPLAGKKERKDIQEFGENVRSTRQAGKQAVQFDQRADAGQAGSQVNTAIPAPSEIDQEVDHGSRPRSSEPFKRWWFSSDAGVKTSPWKIKGMVEGPVHVNEARIFNGQRDASPLEDRKKVEEKRYLLGKFHWPSLPGEKDSEDFGDTDLTPTWPSLPEKRSALVKSPSSQIDLHLTEMEPRTVERLRRLDEEQKGMPWNASHF